MITDREEFVKICGILGYSDVHPTDGKYITSFIVELGKENEKLSKEVDVWNTKYNEVFDENKKLKAELELYKGSLHREHEAIHRANDLEEKLNKAYEEGILDTVKEVQRLEQENKNLKENNQSMQEEMCRTWEKLDKLDHNWNELKRQLQGRITVIEEVYLDNKEHYSDEMILDMTSRKLGYEQCLDIMQELEEENND